MCQPWSLAAQELYRDGTFAEHFVTPAECLTIIQNPGRCTPPQWSTLAYFSIAQGALSKGEFKAGQVCPDHVYSRLFLQQCSQALRQAQCLRHRLWSLPAPRAVSADAS